MNAPQSGSPESSASPRVQVVGAALVDDLARPTRLLAGRRSAPEALEGLWEFPGGKVEAGEDHVQALRRELREELGIEIELGEEIAGEDPNTGFDLAAPRPASMRLWMARITAGDPRPLQDHSELRWVGLEAGLDRELEWIPADVRIVRALLERLSPPDQGRDASAPR